LMSMKTMLFLGNSPGAWPRTVEVHDIYILYLYIFNFFYCFKWVLCYVVLVSQCGVLGWCWLSFDARVFFFCTFFFLSIFLCIFDS
jgi:hypothetical protein